MTVFKIVRIAARVIYQLSGLALLAAVISLIFISGSLALLLFIGAVVGWILAQVLAKIAIALYVRDGGDIEDLETGLWRWRS